MSILLQPTITNKVALTLTEAVTIADPTFLFVLTNSQSKVVHTFIAIDGSEYPYRYNYFNIIVKTNPNPLNGEVDLTIGSQYNYEVREQASTTNLDPALSGKVLEVGILIYNKAYTQREIYTNENNTRKVYQG